MKYTKEYLRLIDDLKDIQSIEELSLRALSQNIGVSHSYLSLFLNQNLDPVSPKLIEQLKEYVAQYRLKQQAAELSKRDEIGLLEILAILDNADNEHAILAALACRGASEHSERDRTAITSEGHSSSVP